MHIYSFTKEPRKSEMQSKRKSREKVRKKKANGYKGHWETRSAGRHLLEAEVKEGMTMVWSVE